MDRGLSLDPIITHKSLKPRANTGWLKVLLLKPIEQ